MSIQPKTILDIWFDGYDPDIPLSSHRPPAAHWFKADEAFDARLKPIEPILEDARRGVFDDWAAEPLGRLALILLCDQVPRNLYRRHRKALDWDRKALNVVLEGLALQHDVGLDPGRRIFFYMPLMHSECLEHQLLCERLARSFLDETRQRWPHQFAYISGFVAEARRHRREIERHGCFRWRRRWGTREG